MNNVTENSTQELLDVYTSSKWLNTICITLITLFGIFGNTISIRIFSSKSYSNLKPLKYYLIMLSMSDLGVLVFHYFDFTFRSWINLTGAYTSKWNFVDKSILCCKLVPYMRNICRTLSVYVLLLLTFQRFISLHFPLMNKKLNSIQLNKKIIVVLVVFSFVLNANNLILNTLVRHEINGEFYCTIEERYLHLQFNFEICFIVFTILIPTILIFLFSVILFVKIRANLPEENRIWNVFFSCRSASSASPSTSSSNKSEVENRIIYRTDVLPIDSNNHNNNGQNGQVVFSNSNSTSKPNVYHYLKLSQRTSTSTATVRHKCNGHSIRTTYMLVILSKWFILLHFPYFICWVMFHLHFKEMNQLRMNILSLKQDSNQTNALSSSHMKLVTRGDEKILLLRSALNLSEILFIMNYSINFLLYFLNGPLFRVRFRRTLLELVNKFKCFTIKY